MSKQIKLGQTPFKDLYQVFNYTSKEIFDNKKAKLFPIGNSDGEVATTSIFLASLSAVKEYREELFLDIGVTKIKTRNVNLHVYTEIFNASKNATDDRPDGLIVITSGKNNPVIEWACFVEAKVNNNTITEEQIERYTDFAREVGINDIITISNSLVTNPNEPIVKIKKRSFNLYHWSWTYLKVMATRLIRTDSIEDEDHIYILSELRRYFDDHKYLKNFDNMGKDWKDAVTALHAHSIEQKIDNDILDSIVESYKQEEKDISLQLTDNTDMYIQLFAKDDRTESLCEMLQNHKTFISQYIIDGNKTHTFYIEVDFIRQQIKCYTHITISKGKAHAQTSQLIKMLENEAGYTDNLLVNAYYIRNKTNKKDVPLSVLISEKNQSEEYSIIEKDLGSEVKFFEIKTCDLLGANFKSTKKFIIELENIAERFLTQVMVNLK